MPNDTDAKGKLRKNLLRNSFWLVTIIAFLVYALSFLIIVIQFQNLNGVIKLFTLNADFFKNVVSAFETPGSGSTLFAVTIAVFISYLIYVAYLVNRKVTVITEKELDLDTSVGGYLFRLFNFILPIILAVYMSNALGVQNYFVNGGPVSIYLGLAIFFFILLMIVIFFFTVNFLDGWWLRGLVAIAVGILLLFYLFSFHSELVIETMLFLLLYTASIKTQQGIVKLITEISSNYQNAEKYVLERLVAASKVTEIPFGEGAAVWFSQILMLLLTGYVNLLMDSVVTIALILVLLSYTEKFTILFPVYILLGLPFWIIMLSILRTVSKEIVALRLNNGELEGGILIQENYKTGYILLLKENNEVVKVFSNSIVSMQKKTDAVDHKEKPLVGGGKPLASPPGKSKILGKEVDA